MLHGAVTDNPVVHVKNSSNGCRSLPLIGQETLGHRLASNNIDLMVTCHHTVDECHVTR